MVIRTRKIFISKRLGGLLLLITLLLVLEKHELLPLSFRLHAATREAWMRPQKSDQDRGRTARHRPEKEVRQLADRWYEELLARHPEMAVTYKDVPDAENGYLKLLEFMERYGANEMLPLPDDIKKLIDGSGPWDPEKFAAWLEENRALMDEITAIGLLPGQSMKGIDFDRYKFTSARIPNQISKLLLAEARLSAERGDAAGSMESVRAVIGLADHMDKVETPTLLAETVSVLLRLNSWKYVTDNILTNGEANASDLVAWRDAMATGADDPGELAHVFRGEWHVTTRAILLPELLRGVTFDGVDQEIRDPDALVETHLGYFRDLTAAMESSTLGAFPELMTGPPPSTAHLSEESRKVMDILLIGSNVWGKGWIKAQCIGALTEASFAAALGEEIPLEPITGKPFVFDAEAGTMAMPDDPRLAGNDFKPMKVPVVRKR